MKSEYNKRSLEMEIIDRIIQSVEIKVSTLNEHFPGLEKEVRLTIGQLQEQGQVEINGDIVRIKKEGGEFKVKDFDSYFK